MDEQSTHMAMGSVYYLLHLLPHRIPSLVTHSAFYGRIRPASMAPGSEQTRFRVGGPRSLPVCKGRASAILLASIRID